LEKHRKIQTLLSNRITSGYSLIELILALFIVSFLAALTVPILKTTSQLMQEDIYIYQDEIGLYQMQIILAANEITSVDSYEITYNTEKNECHISLVNFNVISQPGFICFLKDVDNVYFYQHFGIIYIDYERDGKFYTYPIAYAQ
jgi:prepilin-type N-terminal cleavage/methylation domain-containing protein